MDQFPFLFPHKSSKCEQHWLFIVHKRLVLWSSSLWLGAQSFWNCLSLWDRLKIYFSKKTFRCFTIKLTTDMASHLSFIIWLYYVGDIILCKYFILLDYSFINLIKLLITIRLNVRYSLIVHTFSIMPSKSRHRHSISIRVVESNPL
jgi:hypothetical protein